MATAKKRAVASPGPGVPKPDAASLEVVALQAIANGWPVEEVAATMDGIVGPVSPPIEGRASMPDAVSASPAVQQIFSEAAKRIAEGPTRRGR